MGKKDKKDKKHSDSEEEVKEPAKKRQKTDKPDKKEKKKKNSDDEEDLQNEDTQMTSAAPQQSTIGQVKKIEDKKPFTDQEAEQVIAEWMEKQNRPYSVQNLLDNFQHQLKRNQCMRLMDLLVESQILTCKEYGKAKVYLINQDCFPETNPDQLKLLDEQIQVRKDELNELEAQLKANKDQLKEASSGQSNDAIAKELAQLSLENAELQQLIAPYKQAGAKMLTEEDLQKSEANLKKWQMEWKKKKRGCMDIVNTISESMEMNRKDFIKKVGLDTDEENKVVCPL